ncbi:type II secretion system protein GspK, partial [Escherichia coli]|uniref:type II secretion system protein GspK n=4 Tax=Escherichia coli TaxID=562 RepID=UPI0021BADDEC
GKNSLNRLIRCVCGKKIGPDPRNFNQRVSLGRNDLLIRTFLNMLTENDIPLFRALFLNNITDADARVLLQKRPREGWLTTDAFLYWAQQDFSGVKPLVAQVKRHLFPYSRYFTLSTESISDEQSQGWQSHIFFNRKQQSAQIYRRTLQLY